VQCSVVNKQLEIRLMHSKTPSLATLVGWTGLVRSLAPIRTGAEPMSPYTNVKASLGCVKTSFVQGTWVSPGNVQSSAVMRLARPCVTVVQSTGQ